MHQASKMSTFEVIIAIVGTPLAILVLMWSYSNWNAHTAPDSVLGNGGLSPQFIDSVLCTYKSPACHTGQALFDEGWQHDIDPDYALAFFWQGSNFGKVACTPSAVCIGLTGTWENSYKAWYDTIDSPLYKGSGVVTVPQIVAKIGLPNPDRYTQAVEAAVKLWTSGTVGLP